MLYQRAVDLIEADVGDDLVALDAVGGQCFGFNNVAAEVWRALEQPQSLDQLVTTMRDRFEVDSDECRRDLREVLT